MVRKEVDDERESADFRALQLHYGRLGAAYGRFVAIRDMGGAASNASVETGQSLARVQDSEYAFAARCWLGCYFLWMNMGAEAMETAVAILHGLMEKDWGKIAPGSDEEAVRIRRAPYGARRERRTSIPYAEEIVDRSTGEFPSDDPGSFETSAGQRCESQVLIGSPQQRGDPFQQ